MDMLLIPETSNHTYYPTCPEVCSIAPSQRVISFFSMLVPWTTVNTEACIVAGTRKKDIVVWDVGASRVVGTICLALTWFS